jgi:hypothetical protein
MQEPKVHEDQYVIDDHKVAQYYDNLVQTGLVNSEQLGNKDDFVMSMREPGALLQLRSTLLENKVMTEEQLHSDPEEYFQTFVKKKDRSSQQLLDTTEDSGKSEEELDLLAGADEPKKWSEKDVDDFWDEQEVMQLDYQKETSDEEADEFAIRADNIRYKSAPRNDIVVRHKKQDARDLNNASNDFLNNRNENYTRHLETGELGTYYNDALKSAEEKYNPTGSRTKRRSLKNAMYAAHADQLANTVAGDLEADGWTTRDLVVNPDLIQAQHDRYKELGMPQKQWDLAVANIMQYKHKSLLENEGMHVQEQYLKFQNDGYSEADARDMVAKEIQANQEVAISETFDRKERERQALIQKERDLLNNPKASAEEIYKVRAQIATFQDRIYDVDGKRIGSTGSREVDQFEAELSEQIDITKSLPILQDPETFRQNLHQVRDERWMIRRNLKREYDAVKEEISEISKIVQESGAAAMGGVDKQAKMMLEARQTYLDKLQRKEAHLRQEYRQADLSWQAAGRMLALNENPTADKRGFGYYGQEFVAGMVDYVPNIRKVDKRKMTEADFVREFEGTLSDMGYNLTNEEREYVEKDLAATIVRAGGGGAAFAMDMALTTFLTRGLGVEAAIQRGVGKTRKLARAAHWSQKKFKGARVTSTKALHQVTKHTSAALLEGAKFAITTGEVSEAPVGAGFYAINSMLPGVHLLSPTANAIFNSFYKSAAGLTAASLGTEATHVAYEALRHDQNVRTAIADHFGHGDEITERIVTELAVGLMFGAFHTPNAIKSRHMTATPKQMNWVVKRAVKKGKIAGAIDIANEKFNYLWRNAVYNQAKETQSKLDYLKKRLTKEEMGEMFDRKGVDPEKVNQKFEQFVKEQAKETGRREADIWEEVVGRDSFTTLEQKRLALEKMTGGSLKEYGPGEVEVIYERMRMDKEYAVKLREGMKVIEQDRRIQTREERMQNELDAAKKAVGEENGQASSSEENAKKVEASRTEVSKVEKEHQKEAREKEKNLVPKKIRKHIDEYKASKQSRKKTRHLQDIATDLKNALKQAERSNILRTDNKFLQLKRAIATVDKALNSNDVLSDTAIERLYKSTESALNIFTPKNIVKRLTEKLDDLTLKAKEEGKPVERKFDPKTDFMAKAMKALFTGDTKLIRELSERVSSGLESLSKDKELYDPTQVDRFEAVRDVLENGATRESAKKRRAELEVLAQKRDLTNAEQMAYELLNFRDASSMTMGELVMADASLKVLLNNGSSLKKHNDTFDVIETRTDLREVMRVLDPRRYTSRAAMAEAEKAVTDKQKIDFIERFSPFHRTMKGEKKWQESPESIKKVYEEVVREHHKRMTDIGKSRIRKYLAGGRLYIESFPSIMENFSQRLPGRDAMTGHLHTLSDQILSARRGKDGELGYWASIRAQGIEKIFGTIAKANEKMVHWGKKKHTFNLTNENTEVPLPHEMTIQQALTLLSYSRQTDQRLTWEKKGLEFITKEGGKGRAVRELEAQIEALAGKEAIQWMDYIITEYQPRLYHRLNEKYREHKGTDLEYIINHTPVVRRGTGEKSDRTLFDKAAEDYVAGTMTSAAKSRTGSTEWYDLRNFNELINNHTERIVHYVHFQKPVLRLQRTFGQEEVRSILRDHYGEAAVTIMKRFEADIAADRTTGDVWRAVDKMRTAFVRAKLGVNWLLIPKQMMSVQAYTAGLRGGKEIAEFHQHLLMPNINIMRQISKSEFVRGRLTSQAINRELAAAEAQQATLMSKDPAARAKIIRGENLREAIDPRYGYLKDNILAPTKFGDIGAILIGAQAQYQVVYNRMIKEGYTPKEAGTGAYESIVRGTRRTQQSGAIEDLSHFQRAGTVGKILTMFMNSPMQYARIEMAAWDYLAQAKRDGDMAKLKKGAMDLFFFHFVMPATFHAAMNGFYAGEATAGGDEEMFRTLGLGSLAYVPVMGGLLESIWDYTNTGESFGLDLGVAQSLADEMEVVTKVLGQLIQGEELTPGQTLDIFSSIATLMGVPLDSPYKLVQGIREYVNGETDDPRALLGYSPYMRGAHDRGQFYGLVEKHSRANGGTLGDAFEEVIEKEGKNYFLRNKDYIKKEYLINEKFGGYDRHVNYLRDPRTKSELKAEYIHDLYKVSVQGKRPVMRRNVAVKDIFAPEELTEAEFNRRLGEWMAFGVINKTQYRMFKAKQDGTFDEQFK